VYSTVQYSTVAERSHGTVLRFIVSWHAVDVRLLCCCGCSGTTLSYSTFGASLLFFLYNTQLTLHKSATVCVLCMFLVTAVTPKANIMRPVTPKANIHAMILSKLALSCKSSTLVQYIHYKCTESWVDRPIIDPPAGQAGR
jgi:hypothetical protein